MKAVSTSFVVIVAGIGCLWHTTYGLQAFTAESARRIEVAREKKTIPQTSMMTMTESEIQVPMDYRSQKKRKVTIVEFIYTSCPTICQTAGADLARLRTHLKSEGLDENTKIVSVSFDPETDDLGQLQSYGKTHGADGLIWTIARPSKKDLPNILNAFGVVVIPNEFGGFEHNAAMHIINPKGQLIAIRDTDDINGAINSTRRALQ